MDEGNIVIMKRIILLTSMILCALSLHAQDASDYRPFIEEGKVWVSMPLIDFTEIGIKKQQTLEYNYFQGDTVVADKKCKKWMKDYRNLDGEQLFCCYVSIYEEGGKVWFFFRGETEPRLAYDFGAKEGDTLSVFSPNAYYYEQFKYYGLLEKHMGSFVDTIVVGKRTEEEVFGKRRTLTYFYSIMGSNEEMKDDFLSDNYLMYGIGTHWGPVYNVAWHGQNSGRQALIYCMVGDEVLFADEERASYWGLKLADFKSGLLSPTISPAPYTPNRFDLTGRRLAAPPAKGVYIEGGKVRVAR